MILCRSGDDTPLAHVELADRFWGRLRGLMFRRSLPRDAALWIEPCSSIHMGFVFFAIDVLFARRLDSGPLREGTSAEILGVRQRVLPFVGLAWCAGASTAIELPAGRAAELGLKAGDELRLCEVAA